MSWLILEKYFQVSDFYNIHVLNQIKINLYYHILSTDIAYLYNPTNFVILLLLVYFTIFKKKISSSSELLSNNSLF